MRLAHPYVPTSECGELVVEYLLVGLENKAPQCHLFTTNSSSVAKTVQAIEDYLAIAKSDRATWKAVVQRPKLTEALNTRTETTSAQSEMLSAESRMLAAQPEAMEWMMVQLEAFERVSGQPPPRANFYNEAVQPVPRWE